jgi:two-component system, NarL family, sensor histidine kinase DesK
METARPTWRSRGWSAAVVVLVALALALTTVGFDTAVTAQAVLVVAAAITVAVLVRAWTWTRTQRARYEDELAAWAAERAAQGERLRIAADLHDLVSHGLGLITVRAAAAATAGGPGGDAERVCALADIERVGRETTTELRRVLTVLRAPGPAPVRPPDRLDDLPALVRAAGEAGLVATLDADDVGDVSPGVQLTVCAVVREALANALRHAGPGRARVGIRRDGETILVDVHDDGPQGHWPGRPGTGHGLDGLRERVSALGGTLDAGPDGSGFRLTARIPDRDRP